MRVLVGVLDIYLGIMLLIFLTFLFFSFSIWGRNRQQRSARLFVWLLLALAEWTAATLLFLHACAGSPWKLVFANLQYVGITTVPIFLLLFVLEHTGAEGDSRRVPLGWLLVEPIGYNVLLWADPLLHFVRLRTTLLVRGPFVGWQVSYGAAFWVHALYSYLLVLAGLVVLLLRIRRAAHRGHAQGRWIVAGALAPVLGNIVNVAGLNPTPIDSTFFGFSLTAVTFFFSVGRHRLFRLTTQQNVDSLLEAMSDVVLFVSAGGRVVDANGAALRFFQRPRSRLRDSTLDSLLGEVGELCGSDDSEGEKNEVVRREVMIRRGDGQEVPMEFSVDRSLDDWGNLVGYVLLGRDLSERLRFERERERTSELEATARITGGIAHDFNNILSSVGSYAEFLRRKMSEDSPFWHVPGEIMKAVRRGARQVDRLLLFSEGLKFRPEVVRVPDLLAPVHSMFPEVAEKQLSIELQDGAEAALVRVDRELILEEIRLIVGFWVEHAQSDSSMELCACLKPGGGEAGVELRFSLFRLHLEESVVGELTRLYSRTENMIHVGTEIAVADLIARRHDSKLEVVPVDERTETGRVSLSLTTSLGPVVS